MLAQVQRTHKQISYGVTTSGSAQAAITFTSGDRGCLPTLLYTAGKPDSSTSFAAASASSKTYSSTPGSSTQLTLGILSTSTFGAVSMDLNTVSFNFCLYFDTCSVTSLCNAAKRLSPFKLVSSIASFSSFNLSL